MISLIPVKTIPIIKVNDNISEILIDSLNKEKIILQNYDIIIIAQTIISRAEGKYIELNNIIPSKFALNLSKRINKDPRLIEIILNESASLIKIGNNKIITESRLGFICADAGVDQSNSPPGTVTLLPSNPDQSAKQIKNDLEEYFGVKIGVIITDTHGRPFREGAINVAIGVAGIEPIRSYIGDKDIFNRQLLSTKVAIADEIASAAELLMGESNQKIPVVILRGFKFKYSNEDNLSKKLIRDKKLDLFR